MREVLITPQGLGKKDLPRIFEGKVFSMNNKGFAALILSSAVVVLQCKGETQLQLDPVDGDRGAMLYVYNVEEINETQLKCTVQPGYETTLRERGRKHSENLSNITYDVYFVNEGNMTCTLTEPVRIFLSNTLSAQLPCEETFVAAIRHQNITNITNMVDKYNRGKFRVANVTETFQKHEGDLMITHFTLSAVNCSQNLSFLDDSFRKHMEKKNITLVYWRNSRYCDGTVGEGFNWPRSPIGTSTAPDNPCEDGFTGPIRRCLGDAVTGAYWDEAAHDAKCVKPKTERVRFIENANMDKETIGQLMEVVMKGPPLTSYEVNLLFDKLEMAKKIIRDDCLSPNETLPYVKAVVGIVDAALESEASGETIEIMESLDHILIASTTSVPAVNYLPHLSTYAADETAGVRGIMSRKEDEGKIQEIWEEDLARVNFSHSLWGLVFMGINESGITARIHNSSHLLDDPERMRISPVIGLKVFDKNKTRVDASLLLVFRKDENYPEEKHMCSHWNEHRGKWSQEGCDRTYNKIVPNHMHGCLCTNFTHFTNIAMVIAHGDPSDGPALALITKIGCSASFICVAVAFLCSALNPKRSRTVYGKIELNLFLSIFLLDAIQLVATFFQFSPGGATCIAVGIILHYSVLATFSWTMLIGFMHMLRLNPKTLLSARNMAGNHLLLKATIFGWGVAAIPVTATVSDGTRHYIDELPFCYPKGVALYTAVIFPVGLASVVNTIIFIWVSALLLCVRGVSSQGTNWTRQKMRRIFFLFFLFCLLGLFWVFGLLIEATSGRVKEILKYAFCVTAPLHGLLLFVFLVLCERSVRSKFRETFSNFSKMSRRFTSRITRTGLQQESPSHHIGLTGLSKEELSESTTT